MVKELKKQFEVEESYKAGLELKEARSFLEKPPSGQHPYHLAVNVQKKKMIRDEMVRDLRVSFFVISENERKVN